MGPVGSRVFWIDSALTVVIICRGKMVLGLVSPCFSCDREMTTLKPKPPVEYFLEREVHVRDGEDKSRYFGPSKRR